MNAYLDSSVLLRVVLGRPGRWQAWRTVTLGSEAGWSRSSASGRWIAYG
jgi:hypothetical protein